MFDFWEKNLLKGSLYYLIEINKAFAEDFPKTRKKIEMENGVIEKLINNPILKTEKLPKIIERISDGERLSLNKNGTYSYINSLMHFKFEITYDKLMNNQENFGKFKIVEDCEKE